MYASMCVYMYAYVLRVSVTEFEFDGRVCVPELLYCSLPEEKARICLCLAKIFSLFIFFRRSFSMPGEFGNFGLIFCFLRDWLPCIQIFALFFFFFFGTKK
jgi:hypothetical protein